jgi:RND family efflux transporter MFP subunit
LGNYRIVGVIQVKKYIGLIVLIIFVLFVASCESDIIEKNEAEYSVSVLKIKKSVLEEKLTLPGKVDYYENAYLSFLKSGEIKEIYVNEGESISAGQLIAELDPKGLQLNIQSARSDYNSSLEQYKQTQSQMNFLNTQYDNMLDLYQSGSISKFELDQSKLSYDIAVNNYSSSKSQLSSAKEYLNFTVDSESDYKLVANKDGIVSKILFKEGEMVGDGIPVLFIADLGNFIIINVNYENLLKFQLDNTVNVVFNGKQLEGVVVEIGMNPDPMTLEYMIVVETSTNLPIGEIVKINKIISTYSGIVLPINAILGQKDDYYVYEVIDNKVHKKSIEIIQVVDDKVLVDGIKEGEKIIYEGNKFIKEGFNVYIVNTIE